MLLIQYLVQYLVYLFQLAFTSWKWLIAFLVLFLADGLCLYTSAYQRDDWFFFLRIALVLNITLTIVSGVDWMLDRMKREEEERD